MTESTRWKEMKEYEINSEKPEIEVYTAWDEDTIEGRIEYQIERAEHYKQTVEFHFSMVVVSDNREKFVLLTIRRNV